MPPPEQWGDLMSPGAGQGVLPDAAEVLVQHGQGEGGARNSRRSRTDSRRRSPYPDSSSRRSARRRLALSQTLKKLGIDLTVKEVPTDAWFATAYPTRAARAADHQLGRRLPRPGRRAALHLRQQGCGARTTSTRRTTRVPEMDGTSPDKRSRPGRRRSAPPRSRRRSDSPPSTCRTIPIWYQDIAMAMRPKLQYKGFGTWYLYTPWALQITAR